MKHGRYTTIEGNQEVSQRRTIVDVRTTGQRFKDWMLFPRNFAKVMLALGIACLVAPVLLPILLFAMLAFVDEYSRTSQYLPMRYPAWCKERDPGLLHPGTDQPELPTGIMYFGVVDARDPYERSKQVFLSADDLTRHMLVLGTTGSGKSEFLKGMTFNVLCWASGFFVADAKADNKLPTDMYSQVRMFARDYDWLVVNYLLGGLSPTQISNMRERLSNGLQPVTTADADTIVQMISNILVKASGDSKTWQDRGLNMFRGISRAVTHKRDLGELTLSIEVLREYLSLDKIGDLYVEGYKLADGGPWPTPYLGVKSYLEVGVPGFQVTNLLRKHGVLKEEEEEEGAAGLAAAMGGGAPFGRNPAQQQKKPPTNQTNEVYNQHGYRADQVFPALSLLIDTYGHIFKRKHAEVDMQDVVTNNRICVSLIPSLEKGSQEQESLGKLNLALLRVMMARALGSSIEGDVQKNVDAKITASATPFALFLDEFAYQFAEGIALTAAQARSLNFFLCALAQDLEKLTEGDRAAEAGAMMANQATKFFMKIVGSDKTHDLAQKTLGEAEVAVISGFDLEQDSIMGNVRRETTYKLEKKPRIARKTLEELASGFATFAYRERAHVMRTFYPSPDVPRVRYPRINRFLQIHDLGETTMLTSSVELQPSQDKWVIQKIRGLLEAGQGPSYAELVTSDVIQSIANAAKNMNPHTPAIERGIVLYEAGVQALHHARTGESLLGGGAGRGPRDTATAAAPAAAPQEAVAQTQAHVEPGADLGSDHEIEAASLAGELDTTDIADAALDLGMGPDDAALAEAGNVDELLSGFDPLNEIMQLAPPIARKPKQQVFGEELATDSAQETEAIPEDPIAALAEGDHFDPTMESNSSSWDDEVALITDEPDDSAGESPTTVDAVATTAGVAAPAEPTLPVQVQAEARAGLHELSRTTVDSALIERMGPEVIGLREAAKDELVNLEVTLGATPEQASDAAANTEKAVAQGLSLLDNNKTKTSAADFEILFSELTNLVDNT